MSTVLKDSIERRLGLLEDANASPEFRSLVMAYSRLDVVAWVNDWVWTTDPRKSPSRMPFDLFPKQEEFLLWLNDRYELKDDAIAEKSRDVGFTWLCAAWMIHRWLFYPDFKGTFGSRKSDLVDRLGDPDSIFEKMRLLLRSLPWWMLPSRWRDNELRLFNLDNGSIITGEGGDQMGRGGRSSIYITDEAAFIPRAEKVDAAVSANSDCKIKVSTPNGPGNTFYRQRFSGNFSVFTFDWKDDPRKNHWELKDESGSVIATGQGRDAPIGAVYPWYEKQKRDLDSVVLAQEVDLNYMAAVEGICIPHEWVLAAVELCDRLELPRRGQRTAGLDVADGGKDSTVLITRIGPIVEDIIDRREGNTALTTYWADDHCNSLKVDLLNYDAIGPGANVGGLLSLKEGLRYRLFGVIGGASCTDMVWSQFGDKASEDIFINLRAELWWLLRRRFEKTFEFVNGDAVYPLDELISIPNHATLIAQLSQPLKRYNDTGKIAIESKAEMAKRGVGSPDFADALVYAFAPDLTPVWGVSQASWG